MSSRTREALERAIDEEPYDAEAYAVFGDFLQREGDRRGELIALHLAAERDPACERDAASYLKRHADTFVGDLASISSDGNGDWRRRRRRSRTTSGHDRSTTIAMSIGGAGHVDRSASCA